MDSSASSLSKGLLPVAVPGQQVFIILDGNSSGTELELTFQPTSNADRRSNGFNEVRLTQRRGEDDNGSTHDTTEVCLQGLHPLIEELELTNFSGRLIITLRTKGIANDHEHTITNTGRPDAQKSILSPTLRSMVTRSSTGSTPVREDPEQEDANVPGLGQPQWTIFPATESSSLTGNLDESMNSRISEERNTLYGNRDAKHGRL
ncbi:hypothetical protein MHU86_15254 [Fragilaria crotonensis]|nr:hypothetical protein MHU86_15254 [Fragilaria crotonensis]